MAILKIFSRATKAKPSMWGTAIIGFGCYRYRYASGREGDWFVAGFAPRAQNITFYFMSGLKPLREFLPKLGKHKVSGSCLHVTRVEGIDLAVLEKMVKSCAAICKERNSQDFS